jgi:hypothetical protein
MNTKVSICEHAGSIAMAVFICEHAGSIAMAVFKDDGFDTIRDFQQFPDEKSAMDCAKQWCADNGHEITKVVRPSIPSITRMTWTSGPARRGRRA